MSQVKGVSILGSTGSIGRQALEVVSAFPDALRVTALAAGKNIRLLGEQVLAYRPEVVSVMDEASARELRSALPPGLVEVMHGPEGASAVATHADADMVLSAMVGAAGLVPTIEAIRAGKDIALSNKEVLVIAGEIVTAEAARKGVKLLPVDSEHCAVFQLLTGASPGAVRRVILTASGGPFLNTPADDFTGITAQEALAHPTWTMGSKVTIDSATLMNKGLELIEARWLFDMPPAMIDIWVHPQSIVHSMVEYLDGSFMAQLSQPDMKIPIAFALLYPERRVLSQNSLRPEDFTGLTFEEPDTGRFPALGLARRALEEGGAMPAVLNAANEVAVDAFLHDGLGYLGIAQTVERVMDMHTGSSIGDPGLDSLLDRDGWARRAARGIIHKEVK